MAIEKAKLLIDRIHKRTKAGTLDWDETTDDNIFLTTFPDYAIHIAKVEELNGATNYNLSIFNEEGRLIEKFSPGNIADSYDEGYEILEEIFELARGDALGVDVAIDNIISLLEEGDENEGK